MGLKDENKKLREQLERLKRQALEIRKSQRGIIYTKNSGDMAGVNIDSIYRNPSVKLIKGRINTG